MQQFHWPVRSCGPIRESIAWLGNSEPVHLTLRSFPMHRSEIISCFDYGLENSRVRSAIYGGVFTFCYLPFRVLQSRRRKSRPVFSTNSFLQLASKISNLTGVSLKRMRGRRSLYKPFTHKPPLIIPVNHSESGRTAEN